MCVFLCVLFKTDGRFTLAVVAINSRERMKETAGTLPSLPAVQTGTDACHACASFSLKV